MRCIKDLEFLQFATVVALVAWGLSACTPSVTPVAEAEADDAAESTVVFRDDFDRAELGPMWGSYHGQPGGDPHSWWEHDRVSLADGKLVLTASQREDGQWVTGGVSNASVAQTYGEWEVRFRADAADDITFHLLLWPLSENWPPEIDFLENFGGDRSRASAFLHWIEDGDRSKLERVLPDVDLTAWNTAGVIWREGRIDFTFNGEIWSTIEGDNVPDEPMWLGLQSQASGCAMAEEFSESSCPWVGTPETSVVEFDWVEVRR